MSSSIVKSPKKYEGLFADGAIVLFPFSSPTRIGLIGGVRGPSLEIKNVVCLSSS